MKKLSHLLMLCAGLLALAACNPNRIYEEHEELSPNLEWRQDKVVKFVVPVTDTTLAYQHFITFRYATGYQFADLLVQVTETSPSGKFRQKKYAITVKDKDGDYKGDAAVDIWDYEEVIEPAHRYHETGDYLYTIEKAMPVEPLHMAMEIGFAVDKVPVK